MSIQLEYKNTIEPASDTPTPADFHSWIKAVKEALFDKSQCQFEISIIIVNAQDSQAFNHQYRNKNKPTNVLSFHYPNPSLTKFPLIGDLVFCEPIIKQEATSQHKQLRSHWAHLTVHGTLHLLGYDHESDQQAQQMEALEIRILSTLGYDNPYE